MANPPFNVNGVDKGKLAGDPRYPYGLPKPDNGNYLWIQLFASALAKGGRGGFVMANSAGDAGHSEREIRRKLVASKTVDVMVAIGTNFFYTVTLPVTLWFLDKGKRGTDREDMVLFIDARHLYRQVDRAHRDFLPEQIELLADRPHAHQARGRWIRGVPRFLRSFVVVTESHRVRCSRSRRRRPGLTPPPEATRVADSGLDSGQAVPL